MTAATSKALVTLANLKTALAARKMDWQSVTPKHINVDRLIASVMTAAAKTPALLSADSQSLLMAARQAAQLGLDCSGTLGSAYLIPFSGQVQLIIGYRGLIDLARRSREIVSIQAQCVYAADEFRVELGTEPSIHHVPNFEGDRGKVRCAYAVANLVGGGVQFEVMTVGQMEKIRASSRNGNRGPWVDHTEEMYRKTVLRRLVKWLPLSPELVDAIEYEEAPPASTASAVPVDIAAADVVVETPTESPREPGQEG